MQRRQVNQSDRDNDDSDFRSQLPGLTLQIAAHYAALTAAGRDVIKR